MRAIACIAVFVLLGCALENPAIEPPALDHETFVRDVDPILRTRCANPSCHGNARRPLRVYAPGLFRADPQRLHLPEALGSDEVRANEASAAAFALDAHSALESLLIAKPLARVAHQGGEIFFASDDPECEMLLRWLRTGGLP